MNYKRETTDVKGSKVEFVTIQTNEQNSFTRDNLLEFQEIMEELRVNGEIRAVVLTSENEKFFSNGMDAQNIINTPQENLAEEMGSIVRFFNYLMGFDKPLIAEVGGYAMGGGAVVTLASDFKYMLEGKARISFTEVFFGLPLPGSFVDKTKITVLPPYINDTVYGAAYKASEAKQIGLIDETAPDRDALRKLVMKKLDAILKVPTSAFAGTKRTLHADILRNIEGHMTRLMENFAHPIIMANLLEAMSALKEKRRPRFQ